MGAAPFPDDRVDAALADAVLTLEELCRACAVSPEWVARCVAEEFVVVSGERPEAWRFASVSLRRVRRIRRIELDFGAALEVAALIADLEGEIASLRSRLRRSVLR